MCTNGASCMLFSETGRTETAIDTKTTRCLVSESGSSACAGHCGPIVHPAGEPHTPALLPPLRRLPLELAASAVWGAPPPVGSATPAGSPEVHSLLTPDAAGPEWASDATGDGVGPARPSPTADTDHEPSLSPIVWTHWL